MLLQAVGCPGPYAYVVVSASGILLDMAREGLRPKRIEREAAGEQAYRRADGVAVVPAALLGP